MFIELTRMQKDQPAKKVTINAHAVAFVQAREPSGTIIRFNSDNLAIDVRESYHTVSEWIQNAVTP